MDANWNDSALSSVAAWSAIAFTTLGASLVFVTVILNVSEIAALPLSVAVTFTSIAPTFAFKGVPLNVRVLALKESQDGSALPSESVAV